MFKKSPFIQCLCGFAVFLLLEKIAGDERIELPPKVLETPIIPFDQSPIFKEKDCSFKTAH